MEKKEHPASDFIYRKNWDFTGWVRRKRSMNGWISCSMRNEWDNIEKQACI